MESPDELRQQARNLMQSHVSCALSLYQKLWDTYPSEFTHWDAFYLLKLYKSSSDCDIKKATALAEKFSLTMVRNMFGWVVLEHCFTNKTRDEILKNEKFIQDLLKYSPQKNLRTDNRYPCPLTISVFKVCDTYNEDSFNALKTSQLLSCLNSEFLSVTPTKITTQKVGEVELASDFEKYLALKSKALLKLCEYDKCKETCKEGLSNIEKFHYNNDFWFKLRLALCEDKLGNKSTAEVIFFELLSESKGNAKWFIHSSLSEFYFEQCEYEKAWSYAVGAALNGNEPQYMIGVYLLQARILYKLNRTIEGRILAELLAAIFKNQNWSQKQPYKKLFDFYNIEISSVGSLKEIYADAIKFWQSERYKNMQFQEGVIISLHKNKKGGKLRSKSGVVFSFFKKDFKTKVFLDDTIKGRKVKFFAFQLPDASNWAELIEFSQENHNVVNATGSLGLNGTITNITGFGLFVKLPDGTTGLLHKSEIKHYNADDFKILTTIKVRLLKTTKKGIFLSLEK